MHVLRLVRACTGNDGRSDEFDEFLPKLTCEMLALPPSIGTHASILCVHSLMQYMTQRDTTSAHPIVAIGIQISTRDTTTSTLASNSTKTGTPAGLVPSVLLGSNTHANTNFIHLR